MISSLNSPYRRAKTVQIFHDGNLSFIGSFDKTKYLFHFRNDAAPQFL